MRFNLISCLTIILSVVLYMTTTIASTECNNRSNIQWANDLSKSAIETVWQNLRDKFYQQQQLEAKKVFNSDSNNQLTKQCTGLYIFVSTSMPKTLLKAYLSETSRYGGVLVFKGLPKGSFKELTKLVLQLTSDQIEGQDLASSMQIDDEAYGRFQVVSVPTIVLSQADDYQPTKPATVKFDKIVGNVGVKYALEQFAKSGELARQAFRCLK